MTVTTVPDLLNAAADILNDGGWIRYYLTDPFGGPGGHCAIGALLAADSDDGLVSNRHQSPLVKEALQIIAEKLDPDNRILLGDLNYNKDRDSAAWPIVARWNNTIAKDAQQVIQLLRDTAQELCTTAEPQQRVATERELMLV
jgi:hypothetical protein